MKTAKRCEVCGATATNLLNATSKIMHEAVDAAELIGA